MCLVQYHHIQRIKMWLQSTKVHSIYYESRCRNVWTIVPIRQNIFFLFPKKMKTKKKKNWIWPQPVEYITILRISIQFQKMEKCFRMISAWNAFNKKIGNIPYNHFEISTISSIWTQWTIIHNFNWNVIFSGEYVCMCVWKNCIKTLQQNW